MQDCFTGISDKKKIKKNLKIGRPWDFLVKIWIYCDKTHNIQYVVTSMLQGVSQGWEEVDPKPHFLPTGVRVYCAGLKGAVASTRMLIPTLSASGSESVRRLFCFVNLSRENKDKPAVELQALEESGTQLDALWSPIPQSLI